MHYFKIDTFTEYKSKLPLLYNYEDKGQQIRKLKEIDKFHKHALPMLNQE